MSRLNNLIRTAHDLIQKGIDTYGDDISISCSFGKDSMTVLNEALKIKPDILVIWNNTGNEHPETIGFVHKVVNKYELNFVEMRPLLNFFEIVDVYGLPTVKSRKCTEYFKLNPSRYINQLLGVKANFTGLRRAEAENRKNMPYEGFDNRVKVYRYNPIVEFTDLDIYDYQIEYNIPMNPVYSKGLLRTGCFFCTLATNFGQLKEFKELYPKEYEEELLPYLKKDPRFTETKTGSWHCDSNMKVPVDKEKLNALKDKYQQRLAKRITKGEVLKTSKWFNRELNMDTMEF